MSDRVFKLPKQISTLVQSRNELRNHYRERLKEIGSEVELKFTLDGNLVGDLGEALAVELFGVHLVETKSTVGIDGFVSGERQTVQIKATGTNRGPAFRNTETRADFLLFFDINFENAEVEVIFNGPEKYATAFLPSSFSGQRSLTRIQIRKADRQVPENERLKLVRHS
jgi:hypothetical protein